MSRASGSRVIAFATWLLALLGAPRVREPVTAGRVAAELASLAGLQAGTGRTYIADELRKITGLTGPRQAEEDDDQPAG